jgi:hypothetical protein
MATLLTIAYGAWAPAPDALLVAGDVGAEPELSTGDSGRGFWAFDDTAEECMVSDTFEMPSQYTGSGLTAVIHGFFKSEVTVTDEAVIDIAVEAVTPDSDTLDLEAADSFDTVNSVEIDPPATAGNATSVNNTLTNADSVAAGDFVRIAVRRDTDAAADTATGDFCITHISIEDDG